MPADTIADLTPRQLYTTNYERLKQERQPVFDHCREISKTMMPRSGRFFADAFATTGEARLGRRNDGIYDGTATRDARTCSASLLTTASSASRPWFKLSTGDQDLDEIWAVKVWLEDVRTKILDGMQEAGHYQALHQVYLELVLYGTACAIMIPDLEDKMSLHVLTFGEYCLMSDGAGRVTSVYRELRMTTEQIIKTFGPDKVSSTLRAEAKTPAGLLTWHKVLHVIEPRNRYDITRDDPQNKAWKSVYLELDGDGSHDGLLRESGFDRMPALTPRWDVQGHESYGTSPAMDALGDVMSLQQAQFRLHQAIDYKTKPPLQLPPALRGSEVQMQPGGKNYISGQQPARALWDVTLDVQAQRELIADIQARIHSAFYVDVFLSILNASDTTQRTAAEIYERRDEKFQLLGPVVDRLGRELHKPLIVAWFWELLKRGELRQVPQELSAKGLRIEFISVLSQAQKAIATAGVDRLFANAMAIGQQKPEVWDKFDLHYWADFEADRLGADPRLLVPTDQAVALAEARNRANAAKEQALLAEQGSKAVKNIAPITGADAAGMFSGSGVPDQGAV